MLHSQRHRAESFGADAEQYDRSRPRYPQEMVDRIVSSTPGSPALSLGTGSSGTGSPAHSPGTGSSGTGSPARSSGVGSPGTGSVGAGSPGTGSPGAGRGGLRVLDVGCGTGISARMFRDAGCQVLGVEIDPRMAELALRSGLDVEVAPFEAWDAAGRTFDLLISGQAWHWVDPLRGANKAAEVLQPGGRIALFWNIGAPAPEVAERINEVYGRLAPGLDDYSVLLGHGNVERFVHGADGLRASGRFSDPEQWMFRWDRAYTRAEWLDQLPTHSDHRNLEPERLAPLLEAVGGVIDDFGGTFVMYYSAAVLTAVRLA